MSPSTERKKLRPGRRPKQTGIAEENPFTDRLSMRLLEDLRASAGGGDVWIGLTKTAYQEYLRARGWRPHRTRTLVRRVKLFYPCLTKDGKRFYFGAPIPTEIRERISEFRVGGRPTKDAYLFVFRDCTGRSHAWLFHPRSQITGRNGSTEFARFRQSFPARLLDQ